MPASGKIGNKGGGRRPLEKELGYLKEKLKEQTIEELATDKVFKQIGTLKGRDKTDRQVVEDIALPVYLKSKADKVDIKANLKMTYDKAFNSTSETEGDNTE